MRLPTMRAATIAAIALAVLASATTPATANVGDQWILGIHHIDNQGSFTTYPGAGYAGPQSSGNATYTGDAWGRTGQDGVARVYWELSGLSVNNGNSVPTTTEQYTLEFYGTTDVGHNSWQPVEGDFNGSAAGDGEGAVDPNIPWVGAFGTNHQWISNDGQDNGLFNPLGPGPHTPDSDDFNAGANGIYMWLTSGSWLYSKWNLGFDIDRTWSAIRLTQVTGIPEPSTVMLTGLGIAAIGMLRRRRTAE